MDKHRFKYIPSFFSGEYGSNMRKHFRFTKTNLSCRYYADEFPEKYRYKYALISAGANPPMNYRTELDLDTSFVFGDSGGYQIASGALKWNPKYVPIFFEWLENNSDVAMNLDIPPRMKYAGKYKECLEISRQNFKYFADHQTGKTQFLNILQGVDELTFNNWYNGVKEFPFSGWSIGGTGGQLFRFFASMSLLLKNKEHLKPRNKYFHILGTSRIRDFLMLLQLQKSLEEVGSDVIITTDSSSPDRAVVFGHYYLGYHIKRGSFEMINLPNPATKPDTIHEYKGYGSLPAITAFDDILKENFDWDDVVEWNRDCKMGMRLHNFYVFKQVIGVLTDLVYGHDEILQEALSADTYKLLTLIDTMVKKDPIAVFKTNEPFFTKLNKQDQKLESKTFKKFQ